MSRKHPALQLGLIVMGVSGVISLYAGGPRESTEAWIGLWLELAFFGGGMVWIGWFFGRLYEQELLAPARLLTEDERNRVLMRLTLPRWRRGLGWMAIFVPGLFFWVLLYAAVRYGKGSGWAFFFAGLLSIV